MAKRKKSNHGFAKVLIVHCVLWGTALSIYALLLLQRTGRDATGLLAVILAFLGGELLLMCLRTVLNEAKKGGGNPPTDL